MSRLKRDLTIRPSHLASLRLGMEILDEEDLFEADSCKRKDARRDYRSVEQAGGDVTTPD